MLMRNVALSLAVIIAISLLGLCSCGKPAANGVKIMSDPEILNSVMDYIKQSHPDTAPFIKENISWAPGSPDIKYGYTRCTYTGDGWVVTIGHAVTPEVIYEIRAEYEKEGIVWVGTIQNDAITEKSYTRR